MTAGHPPSPTFRSIFGGIAALVLLLLGFLFLGNIVKQIGMIFTFLPSKLGLIETVTRKELITMDMTESPTIINFNKAGKYLLYTDNYDLLVIHDAVVESNAKPWIKILTADEKELDFTLVGRGLKIYDTPLAKGRPTISFEITEPGEYVFIHPRRSIKSYIVPDYITGHEGFINFLIIVQVVVLIIIIIDIRNSLREKKKKSDA